MAAEEHRPPAFDIHAADQQLTAMAQVPEALSTQMVEAISALTVDAAERGANVQTIAGYIHGIVTLILGPLLIEGEQPPMPPVNDGGCRHRWGAGLGEDFTLGSVENPAGTLMQVCVGCGARRRV